MQEPEPKPPGKLRANLKFAAGLLLVCYGPLLLFELAHLLLYLLNVIPTLNGLMRAYTWWLAGSAGVSVVYFHGKGRRKGLTILASALIGVLCLGIAFAVNFKAVRVEGNSMSPTLHPGDVLLVDLTEKPEASGGIYVLDVEGEPHNPLIKRLIGLPGETIDVRYGRVFADDAEVFPRDGTPSDTWNETRPAERHFRVPKTLGDDEYFFLGDNPPESRDSRQFGPVNQKGVKGRVVWSLRGSRGFAPVALASSE